MHARIIRTQIRPGAIDEAANLFRTDVIPAAAEQPELGTIVLLADRASGKGLTMTLWQSEAAMRAAQESGWTQQQVARFANLLAGQPTIETYEVSVRERPATESMTHARVVSLQVAPGKLDEAIGLYRDSVIPAARAQRGFRGGVLLTDRATGKGLSVTAWSTEADMQASDAGGYLQQQIQKFGSVLAAQPAIETYEVTAVRLGP